MTQEIKDKILEIIKTKPKHFSQIIPRNHELMKFINEEVVYFTSSFPEKLFHLFNDVLLKSTNPEERTRSFTCEFGNTRKFSTFTTGYLNCAKTGKCECAKQQVSASCESTCALRTKDEQKKINKKREITVEDINGPGIKNNGQTAEAKKKHKEFYEDEDKVEAVTVQIKKTKKENHGDENYNNRAQTVKTCMKRYGVKNTWSLREDKQNPYLRILRKKKRLSKFYPKYSVEEISKKFNVHLHTVYRYLALHKFRDPYQSSFEKEIIFWLQSLGITNIISNNRKLIGKELDIYLPDYKIAIEYNGLYWHHDKIPHITKSYHYDKFINCEKLGIELITIFGHTWESKKDIWKSKILSKLQIAPSKIGARKTAIVKIEPVDTKDFLNKHHIQGYCSAQICYSLRFSNEIVAVMTFSKKRIFYGKKSKKLIEEIIDDNIILDTEGEIIEHNKLEYELVRYATSVQIPGGASRLLNQFIKDFSPSEIISYSSNEYSSGNLYNKLGFALKNTATYGYSYFDPNIKKMYHRFNFTKQALIKQGFDKSKTEFEIMDESHYLRIWNCGTRTWILKLENNTEIENDQ